MPKGVKGFQRGHGFLGGKPPIGSRNSPRTEFKEGYDPPSHKNGCRCFRCLPARREGNNKWVGGSENWAKRQAKVRDGYVCQICGLKDEEIMQIDHIIPKSVRPDLSASLENMMTLCPNCHARKTIREKKNKIYNN